MYTRYSILRHILPNLIRYQSSCNEDIFFRLTNDYNRKHFVHSDLLSNAIKNINSNLSEKHSLVILAAAARYIHHVTPEKRVELLEEAWKMLNEKKVRLTTRHYETYLSGLNENGFLFDSDYYLKLIDTEQIQATPRLYTLLLNQYCREGQIDRAEGFLNMLKERNLTIDENIFAAIIVCQLKLGNTKNANDIIQQMKDRDAPPTISTYKEILTALISEHKLEDFKHYFYQIDPQQSLTSTLYIDTQLVFILLGQCVSYKERSIFDFLFTILKDLEHQRIEYHLFNLAIQCLSNEWYECSFDLLEEVNIHEKYWILFFKHLFSNDRADLIEIFMKLMAQKQLKPLDVILRVYYTDIKNDCRLALNYLEQGEKLHHPMRTNYFYPLLIHAYSSNTSSKWTEDDRLRLYRLLNDLSIPIDPLIYSNLFRSSFLQYHQNDFRSLFNLLSTNNLDSILDQICRLLLHDVRHEILPLHILEQIAPYFRLQNHTRQEELAKYFFSMIAEKSSLSIPTNDINSIFNVMDSLSKNLANEIPLLKRELYIYLLCFSVQHHREDLTTRLAEQCIRENIKIDRSISELHSLTDYRLSDDIVEQLSRYKPDQLSWKEKLSKILMNKTNRKKLEEVYSEAKGDGRYPISIQQRLLEVYVQKRLINEALGMFKEINDNRYKVDCSTYHRLFNLVTPELDAMADTAKNIDQENIKYFIDLYEKSFGLINLPSELTFRLAHLYLSNHDEDTALKLISNRIDSNLNSEILQYLAQYLRINSSLITINGLISIGNLLLSYRPNESIRNFWNHFFDILLEKTSPTEIVQFYSEAMKKNSHIPYLHLFKVFIEKDEINRLQDVIDIATLHHGSQNVFHDLGFVLIQSGKTKQAERIFQKSWLKARNERISLHATLFAESDNLRALMSAINLTRNLPGVNQKQLFASAIQVAIRLEKSDIVDWLIKEIEENKIQIDIRVRKFLDAHLLSKGLDRLNIEIDDFQIDKQEKSNGKEVFISFL